MSQSIDSKDLYSIIYEELKSPWLGVRWAKNNPAPVPNPFELDEDEQYYQAKANILTDLIYRKLNETIPS